MSTPDWVPAPISAKELDNMLTKLRGIVLKDNAMGLTVIVTSHSPEVHAEHFTNHTLSTMPKAAWRK